MGKRAWWLNRLWKVSLVILIAGCAVQQLADTVGPDGQIVYAPEKKFTAEFDQGERSYFTLSQPELVPQRGIIDISSNTFLPLSSWTIVDLDHKTISVASVDGNGTVSRLKTGKMDQQSQDRIIHAANVAWRYQGQWVASGIMDQFNNLTLIDGNVTKRFSNTGNAPHILIVSIVTKAADALGLYKP